MCSKIVHPRHISFASLEWNWAASQPCHSFFCAKLCSFLQFSFRLFNYSEFSLVDTALIPSFCHVIDLKFMFVIILLYVSLLEFIFCVSLGWNVQLNTSSEDSKNSLGGEKFLLASKFSIRRTRISNDGVLRIVPSTGDESILQH